MEELKPKEGIKTLPVKKGFIRLYRGETSSPSDIPSSDWLKEQPEILVRPTGSFFTDSFEEAKHYNKEFGINDGNATFVGIPENELEKYRASNNRGKEFSARDLTDKEFFLPEGLSNTRKKYQE